MNKCQLIFMTPNEILSGRNVREIELLRVHTYKYRNNSIS